ncbi:MAG: tetratricopeptide repeat protein [Longimicrobiales bacterium]
MSLRRFFGELKRRHVMRVTGVYLVAAWAIVQVAATVFPLLGFPESAATVVVIIAFLGLPVAILLTWMFDVTPQGIQRTADLPAEVGTAEQQALPAGVQEQIEAHRQRFAARAMGFVGVGILVALVGFAAMGRFGMIGSGSAQGVESIAVLPFADLSAARNQGYFTDGVTEELINRLAQVEGLRVAARTSSFAFRERNLEVNQIGEQLRVDAVLEGSVRRDGENLRVTARLVNARTQESIWAQTYERKDSSIFAIQDEIASAIVDALKMQVGPAAQLAASDARGTRNAHAHELYLKGLKAWHERTEAQLQVALQFFEQAVEADTTYALAYAGLAKTYAVLPTVTNYPVVDALRKGNEAAARASLLDPGLSDAHAALGQLAQNLEWDLTSALRSYRRAVKMNANDAVAHQWYAEALMMTGDLQAARTEIEEAIRIDPLSAAARSVQAYQLLLKGEFARADSAYQKLVRDHPGFRLGALNYAFAARLAQDYRGVAEGLIAALPHYAPDVSTLISAASGQGERAEAVRAIEAIARTEPASITALLYACIGEHERALAALEQTFKNNQDANLPYILVHPLLRPLHAQARFQQIVRTVGVTLPA